jgi:hypothetical protein
MAHIDQDWKDHAVEKEGEIVRALRSGTKDPSYRVRMEAIVLLKRMPDADLAPRAFEAWVAENATRLQRFM